MHAPQVSLVQLNTMNIKLLCLLLVALSFSCQDSTEKATVPDHQTPFFEYIPDDPALFEEIKAMDKLFFTAYNTCDLDTQAKIFADDIEFFHDQGGLITSKEAIMQGTKDNICGKVQRELVDGTVEVYPIKDYGAIQIGYHKFYNNQEPDAVSKPSKFISTWRKEGENWRLAKVISLH